MFNPAITAAAPRFNAEALFGPATEAPAAGAGHTGTASIDDDWCGTKPRPFPWPHPHHMLAALIGNPADAVSLNPQPLPPKEAGLR
ncbi:MAG TPA: hypothetical protein VF169_03055 [Albitalea sp.]|uniref:hypothetical protein n=1 Tax=Piscinibacter sp. TaxID=1903157 RepID=UPI002ED2A6BF